MAEAEANHVVAAGGVVWRDDQRGNVAMVVVHRARYDDWSLPKGKIERGESLEACALREVHEETGLRCRLGTRLPTTRYIDHRDRPKEVTFWTMTVIDGAFAANDEVDAAVWLGADDVLARLSYESERAIARAAMEVIANGR